MWIGTRNGLNRFDGQSFKVFRPGPGASITSEVINDIEEDSKGRLWIGTMEGLNIYDPATGKWEVMVPNPDVRGKALPNYIIWDIWIAPGDIAWIVCDVFELVRYDIAKKEFTFYDWPAFARKHPAMQKTRYHSILRLVPGDADQFWLATNNGLVNLDTRTRTFTFAGGNYYGDVIGLERDAASGQVFLTTESGELFRYDEKTKQYGPFTTEPLPYPSTRLQRPGPNEIWMASRPGLVRISGDRQKALLETNLPQLSGSLLPGGVTAVYTDHEGLRWAGTANGVCIYDLQHSASAFLPLMVASDKEGMNRISGVFFDESSRQYFVCAAEPAAVFIISAETGEIRKVTTDAAGRPLSMCINVRKDREQNLWLLTGNGVYRYNRGKGSFTPFPMPGNNAEVVFREMLQDENGDYWFCSSNHGVYYYKTKEKRFAFFGDSSVNLFSSSTGLQARPQDHLVVGSTFGEGVFTCNLATQQISRFYETQQARDYSQLNMVHSMTTDSRGQIWLASYSGGVYRYNPGQSFEKSFTRFDMRHGLSSNSVLSICPDDDTTLWLMTPAGIAAMHINGTFLYELNDAGTFHFSAYASDSRYPHDMYYHAERKELLAGAGGGLLFYSPLRTDTSLHFPIAITGIMVNEKPLTPSEFSSNNTQRLPFQGNSVLYEFAGLYYGNEPGILFEYKLDGYDVNWRPAGKQRSAFYQNLPSGNYQFRVRARLPDGHIAGEVEAPPLSVVLPFWKRWWFALILVALLGLVSWWFIRSLQIKLQMERMINSFATSLYGQNSTEDILWDTARNCIEKLGFKDCVIYQRNESRDVLMQVAAFGPKNPYRREIVNVIEIPVGQGIVGAVAASGKPLRIKDTSKDARYIVDDESRLSEMAVPVMVDGKVFAVIDSEHPQKNFYTRWHMRVMKKVAAICAERITRYLTEEKLRAKIARDLHDEMGSTLTSINIISTVAMGEKQEAGQLAQYFRKIKDHSGRMMESMSDMVWAINPVNDNFDKVVLRMKEFAAELLEPARISYYFTEDGLEDNTFLNLEQRKDIYMIFKEAINNVVKYSGATEVNIILRRNGNLLRMVIADNGRGFDVSRSNSGNGLKNMHTRAEEMGATIRVESVPGTGTSIQLELPLTANPPVNTGS